MVVYVYMGRLAPWEQPADGNYWNDERIDRATGKKYAMRFRNGRRRHAMIAEPTREASRSLCGLSAVNGLDWIGGWNMVDCWSCQRSPAYRQWRQEQGIT